MNNRKRKKWLTTEVEVAPLGAQVVGIHLDELVPRGAK